LAGRTVRALGTANEAARLPIDAAIARLIAPQAANSPRLRPAGEIRPLGSFETILPDDEAGDVLPFCPYREV
jgi:hypothetical protein